MGAAMDFTGHLDKVDSATLKGAARLGRFLREASVQDVRDLAGKMQEARAVWIDVVNSARATGAVAEEAAALGYVEVLTDLLQDARQRLDTVN